jgi:hypothetical protein
MTTIRTNNATPDLTARNQNAKHSRASSRQLYQSILEPAESSDAMQMRPHYSSDANRERFEQTRPLLLDSHGFTDQKSLNRLLTRKLPPETKSKIDSRESVHRSWTNLQGLTSKIKRYIFCQMCEKFFLFVCFVWLYF